ncbi:MAG: hypothetical protein PUP92_36845 [Rhizonema sp. PD38]|nr:hypothetical protein [Rhizonema sp. PD38]
MNTKLDKVLARLELLVAWFIFAILSVIGISNLGQPIVSCFYFLIAGIICPNNSLPNYQKFIIVLIAFISGMWLGLI